MFTLTVDTVYNDTLVQTACDSAEWNGVIYTLSGVYRDTLQSILGCDSIVTLDLTINGSGAGDTTTLVACDSAVWNSITYDSSGVYVDTLQM